MSELTQEQIKLLESAKNYDEAKDIIYSVDTRDQFEDAEFEALDFITNKFAPAEQELIKPYNRSKVEEFADNISDEEKEVLKSDLELFYKKEALPIFLSESSKQLSSIKFKREKRDLLAKVSLEVRNSFVLKNPNVPDGFINQVMDRWSEKNLKKVKRDVLLEEDLDLDMSADSQELPTYKWLVKDIGLCAGAVNLIAGQAGKGKTMLAQHLAVCVASGLPFLGQFPVEQGEVVHVDFDRMGRTNTHIRYIRIAKALGVSPKIKFASLKYKLDSIEFDEEGNGIKEHLIKLMTNKKLIIIDSLRAGTEGDENDSSIRNPLDMISDISEETGCTVIIICHSPRNDSDHIIRGSTAIEGACAQCFGVRSEKGSNVYSVSTEEKHRILDIIPFTYQMYDGVERVEQWNASEKLHFNFLNQSEKEPKKEKESVEDIILKVLKDTSIENQMPLTGEKGVGLEKTVAKNKSAFDAARKSLISEGKIIEVEVGNYKKLHYYIV